MPSQASSTSARLGIIKELNLRRPLYRPLAAYGHFEGWTLNEYALTEIKGGKVIASKTEEDIYAKLKLEYVPPELRENTGEIEAAEAGKLPHLIELGDMRGDVHMHTVASDGRNTIEEMAAAAKDLGYEYIALTDHSKAVTVANGLDEKRALEQIGKFARRRSALAGFACFAGWKWTS